jgi:hypothetical protein
MAKAKQYSASNAVAAEPLCYPPFWFDRPVAPRFVRIALLTFAEKPMKSYSNATVSTFACWSVAVVVAWTTLGCKPEEERQKEIAAAAAQQAAPAAPTMQDRVAGVGVGVQGRSLEGGSDYNPAKMVSGPAAAYFRTKEKIVFEIQVPHTLNAFVALNGRHPKSHEEYMREIIGTQIKLPKLPDGMVYRYHPESQELWVEADKPTDVGASEGSSSPGLPGAGDPGAGDGE